MYDDVKNKVYNLNKHKEIAMFHDFRGNGHFCKMKSAGGAWKRLPLDHIKYLSGLKISLEGYSPIPKTNQQYYINKYGSVISFVISNYGKELKINYHKDIRKYPDVNVLGKTRSVHSLLAITYIDENYIEKGLCCLHLDNNKNNHVLSNLKIGTYSENNKQAYTDGLNKGNGLKKDTP